MQAGLELGEHAQHVQERTFPAILVIAVGTLPLFVQVMRAVTLGWRATKLGVAVGRLLPGNLGRVGGDLLVRDRSVFACDDGAMRQLRRDLMGFVFQNPMQALDPTMRVERLLKLSAAGP